MVLTQSNPPRTKWLSPPPPLPLSWNSCGARLTFLISVSSLCLPFALIENVFIKIMQNSYISTSNSITLTVCLFIISRNATVYFDFYIGYCRNIQLQYGPSTSYSSTFHLRSAWFSDIELTNIAAVVKAWIILYLQSFCLIKIHDRQVMSYFVSWNSLLVILFLSAGVWKHSLRGHPAASCIMCKF